MLHVVDVVSALNARVFASIGFAFASKLQANVVYNILADLELEVYIQLIEVWNNVLFNIIEVSEAFAGRGALSLSLCALPLSVRALSLRALPLTERCICLQTLAQVVKLARALALALALVTGRKQNSGSLVGPGCDHRSWFATASQ